VAHGHGAALLKDLPRFERIVRSTVNATKLPVTVKTRLGWDTNSIVIEDVARMVEAAGVQAIAVHCRTRNQAHNGKADWQWLEKIKKIVTIPVIGNGDVVTPEDAQRMFSIGCDGVMIGRGALTNPWIFRQTKHYLRTGEHLPAVPLEDRIGLCIEHLKLSVHHNGLRDAIIPFRKYYLAYLRGIPHINKLRQELMQLADLEKIIACLQQFLTLRQRLRRCRRQRA
jgi:nifR3 family TIM-barrel protein